MPLGDPTKGSSPPYLAERRVRATASGRDIVSAVPDDPLRLSRRTALRTTALTAGAVAVLPMVLVGCDDEPARPGKTGGADGPDGTSQPAPSTDPAAVAALSMAADQIAQLALRYSSVRQTFPAVRSRLSPGLRLHAAHLAKLKEVSGAEPPQPGQLPPLPKTAAAAVADLATREQKLAVTHSVAAAKLSGTACRLLAMVAASESQLAATLTKKKQVGR